MSDPTPREPEPIYNAKAILIAWAIGLTLVIVYGLTRGSIP